MNNGLYADGEERFGFFAAHLYNFSQIIPVFRRYNKFVLGDLQSFQAGTIMDVGCGTGNLLILYSKLNSSAENIGIDPSKDMIGIASKRAKSVGVSQKTRFLQGSSRLIPVDNKFDIIYASMSFHHWSQKTESISYLMKFLKPKGILNIYEMLPQTAFLKKPANKHTMSEQQFNEIGKTLNLELKIKSGREFIRCSYLKAEE
jgi:ubiquinone/menaquinone biosynthesis C-methylase UbiE